jgi:hypothetical protein
MSKKKFAAIALTLLGLTVITDDAIAIIGRPLTPMSYAGVARRTVRRSAMVYGAYGAYPYGY